MERKGRCLLTGRRAAGIMHNRRYSDSITFASIYSNIRILSHMHRHCNKPKGYTTLTLLQSLRSLWFRRTGRLDDLIEMFGLE